LRAEREHRVLVQAHRDLQNDYSVANGEIAALRKAAEEDTRLHEARQEIIEALDKQHMLQADLDMQLRRSSDRLRTIQDIKMHHKIELQLASDRLRAAQEATRGELDDLDDAWQKRHTELDQAHSARNDKLSSECDELEARVDDLLEALSLEGASGDGRVGRPPRVVPRSQGVLCAGCLTQILYRDVQPIGSAEELWGAAQRGLDKEKAVLFEKSIGGPDPHDLAHTFLWDRRKDPPKTRKVLSRPRSAVEANRKRHGRAEAMREEVVGFRNVWRG